MQSPSGNARLQILTVSDVLTQGVQLSVPVLITQIDSAATLQTLKAALQARFPDQYPVTLMGDLSDADLQSAQLMLEQIGDQMRVAYPISVYVPVQVSEVAIALQQFAGIVAQLRDPEDGCPWDLAQTPQSLTPYILEEAYEAVDAINQGDQDAIAEELGDLLLQVVLQAQLASEDQDFTLKDITQGIADKMMRRHPHVFGDTKADSIEEVRSNWEDIKAAEKQQDSEEPEVFSQKLRQYTRSLPPLMAGAKLSAKAAAAGLEWQDIEGVWAKFYEELAEFQESLLSSDVEHQTSELGDLLFTLINIARWCQLDSVAALRSTNLKLIDRIKSIEANTSKPLTEHTLDELEALWQQAKQELARAVEPAADSQSVSASSGSPESELTQG
ncbi:MAG: nucleoside triphosphate pyrophosphohydrolase [Cyanobacteria bacterium P01_A01_bin.17]